MTARARMRGWLGPALGLALWLVACAAGAAERVALVIGNADYDDDAADLQNPGNDADRMTEALKGLGFTVVTGKDLDTDKFDAKLHEFGEKSRDADVTLFFYAGHGLQVRGQNWLMPINATLEKERDLERRAVKLDAVMREMRGTKKLVFLDACRNNPLARGLARSMRMTRSEASNRGLARVKGVPGTLVVYATEAGEVASDGPGDNSPFTEALLEHIGRPDLHVFAMIDKVAQSVLTATNHAQKPSIQSLPMGLGNFYLASAAAPPEDTGTSTAGGTEPGGSVQPPRQRAEEIVLPDGLTLADWSLLAEDRLKAGDHARLLEEADAHLREYGPVEPVEAVREQALSGLVSEVRVTTREDARGALERIAQLEAAAGERPELLHQKARAHGLLGDHAAEEAAYLEWLRSVPQTHPERRDVLTALARVRVAREKAKRFTELLGRPFSHEWKEDSAGWTDLHYAALLDLPGVVTALVEAGMDVDTRLKDGHTPFGDDLKRTLAALGHGEFEDRTVHGETPLMIAAVGNARDAAAELIAQGADVSAREEEHEWTPLHYAARDNSIDVAKLLIDRGAGVDAKDSDGDTPLHIAAQYNSLDMAKLLIDRGVDVEAKEEHGWTPLYTTTWKNSHDVAKLLIDRGAEVDAKISNDSTPLHMAARYNSIDVAKLLIDRGVEVDAKATNGWRPLHTAAWKNSHDVAKLLIDRGADVDAKDSDGDTPLHIAAQYDSIDVAKLLVEHNADVHAQQERRWTPLHSAAVKNSHDVAKLLIDRGADVEAKEENGWTPLHIAAWKNYHEVAKLLIDHGADLNVKNFSRNTPLQLAVYYYSLDVAKLIVERGAEGITPLHRAAFDNSLDVAKRLVDQGADVNAKTDTSLTPLYLAAWNNSLDMAKLLIDRGADVSNKYGHSKPLVTAAYNNSLDVAKLLIEHGVSVHTIDHEYRTSLHLTIYKNSIDVAKLLVKHGADVNAITSDGETPLDMAIARNHGEMQAMLRRHGARCAKKC